MDIPAAAAAAADISRVLTISVSGMSDDARAFLIENAQQKTLVGSVVFRARLELFLFLTSQCRACRPPRASSRITWDAELAAEQEEDDAEPLTDDAVDDDRHDVLGTPQSASLLTYAASLEATSRRDGTQTLSVKSGFELLRKLATTTTTAEAETGDETSCVVLRGSHLVAAYAQSTAVLLERLDEVYRGGDKEALRVLLTRFRLVARLAGCLPVASEHICIHVA